MYLISLSGFKLQRSLNNKSLVFIAFGSPTMAVVHP
jgi:hypothetical protein